MSEIIAYIDERIHRFEKELIRLDSDHLRNKAHNTPYCLGARKANSTHHLVSLKRIKQMLIQSHSVECQEGLAPSRPHSQLSEQCGLPVLADLHAHSEAQ